MTLQGLSTPAPRARGLADALRSESERHQLELLRMMGRPGAGGMLLARRHAELSDALLQRLYTEVGAGYARSSFLLGAVGGYGRQLLGFKSDLDVCFVTAEAPQSIEPLVDAMLYPLWDAGISIGHQVVGLSEVVADADKDVSLATELLDFRPLVGDVTLMHRLRAQLSKTILSEGELARFIGRLEEQARIRHDQFGDSIYLLEPEVKNGTGGLRDLDFALWAALARFGTSDLQRLATLGLMTHEQRGEAERALDFLWTVRNRLHRTAARKSDRLGFREQEIVASALGVAPKDAASLPTAHRTTVLVETFMSDYYRHARVIARTRDRILGHAKRYARGRLSRPEPIEAGMVMCEGRVGLAEPARLFDEPLLALRVYAVALAREKQVLARTRDAIMAATADAGFCERLRADPRAGQLFVELACAQQTSAFPGGSVLTELHEVDLLTAMLPELLPVVGRVHHDLYHVYTVDVHSIAAVDRLRALLRGELATQHPLGSRLALQVEQPRVLLLAALLHDAGKAIGDHAARGARMVKPTLERLGLSRAEVDDVCHLVRHHLTLYLMAVRRDLGDPSTAKELVRIAHGSEGLRDLYLLTIANLSTTGPGSMTPWTASQLDLLMRSAEAQLGDAQLGDASSDAALARLARVHDEVRALWAKLPEGPSLLEPLEHYLRSMPERYFLSNTPREIAAHAALAIGPREAPIECSVVPSHLEGLIELCVVAGGPSKAGVWLVASDRPGLLASIAVAISANGLSIQSAQVNSRLLPNGSVQAVDVFTVRGAVSGPGFPAQLAKLKRDLTAAVEGTLDAEALLKPPRKPAWSVRATPPVPTEIVFDHLGSPRHTIVEVRTQDRPALLFMIARTMHKLGISISIAKISTEGRRAIDVFYVNETDGGKLDPGARSEEVEAAIVAGLKALEEHASSN